MNIVCSLKLNKNAVVEYKYFCSTQICLLLEFCNKRPTIAECNVILSRLYFLDFSFKYYTVCALKPTL